MSAASSFWPGGARRAASLTLAVIALTAAGCGGGGPAPATPEQRTAIEKVITDYGALLAHSDFEGICSRLVAPNQRADDPAECLGALGTPTPEQAKTLGKAIGEASIDRIDITADGVIGRVYFNGSDQFTRVTFEGGDWYLAPAAPQ